MKTKKKLQKFTLFRPKIRSRHPSHSPLRTSLSLLPFRSVVRLGSTTKLQDNYQRVECNTVDAVKTSSSKLLMKEAFESSHVITAKWWSFLDSDHNELIEDKNFIYEDADKGNGSIALHALPYPIVAKHIHGSRGTGNYLLKTKAELEAWVVGKNLSNYIFEKFYDYSREYRLHVTKDGCFYTCRKMLKNDTPENKRWFRNDSNSTWVLESNPAFDKPVNWDAIVAESVKALKAVGLDIGAIDVKVQSAKKKNGTPRENPKFIILETNSAPSLKNVGLARYLFQIPIILKQKYQEL